VNGASSTTVGYGPDGLPSQIGSLMITRDPTLTVSGGGQGASGLIASTRLGSAVSDTWGYNWFGEFTDYTATFGSTTYTLNLVRDSLGRVITKTENGAATSYTYDTLGRVSDVCTGTDTTCQTGAVLRSYVYYPNGNRKLTPTGSGSVSVDNQDRLESYGATTYTFTDGGDLATKTDGTGTTTYSYDRRRNLRTVTLPNNVTINYTVDGMNRRVGRSVSLNGTNVATQYWIYQNGLQPIAELNGAGTVVSVFVYGTRDNVPDYMIQGSKTYRLITDQVTQPLVAGRRRMSGS
jgi:YD repeat-containing protein